MWPCAYLKVKPSKNKLWFTKPKARSSKVRWKGLVKWKQCPFYDVKTHVVKAMEVIFLTMLENRQAKSLGQM